MSYSLDRVKNNMNLCSDITSVLDSHMRMRIQVHNHRLCSKPPNAIGGALFCYSLQGTSHNMHTRNGTHYLPNFISF